MNSLSIAGNVAREAELKYMPNGDAVASFSLADNQGKDKAAIFWRCSLFGKRAESLAPYLMKGQAVTVTGTLTEREYTDKDGMQKKAQEVRVNDVALQGGKREEAPQRQAAPAQRPQAKPAAPASAGFDLDDTDLPF